MFRVCLSYCFVCSLQPYAHLALVYKCSIFLFFVTFPYGVLGKVWYLIGAIPDLCLIRCFGYVGCRISTNSHELKERNRFFSVFLKDIFSRLFEICNSCLCAACMALVHPRKRLLYFPNFKGPLFSSGLKLLNTLHILIFTSVCLSNVWVDKQAFPRRHHFFLHFALHILNPLA